MESDDPKCLEGLEQIKTKGVSDEKISTSGSRSPEEGGRQPNKGPIKRGIKKKMGLGIRGKWDRWFTPGICPYLKTEKKKEKNWTR